MKTSYADQVPMFRTAIAAIDLSPAQDAMVGCMGDLLRWGIGRLVLVLFEAAAEAKADLVVVGSRSHNLASRMFLGSVARAVIRRTRLPLLLQWIEPGAASAGLEVVCAETLRHVVLATDLSKHAQGAERATIALASRTGLIDCLSVMTPEAIETTPALPVMARAALDELLGRIARVGGRGEAVVIEGDPKESIARIARERDCSLIIVGKHGQGWVESMIIGSTAASVCEAAGRPVLLVP